MSRFYMVVMSLLAVVGVMSFAAATDTTGRAIGIVMFVAGLGGVFAAIMSRRKSK